MIKVAILGATGMVGQKFVSLLLGHPQFDITELVASERSADKPYGEACNRRGAQAFPQKITAKKVLSLGAALESRILFSGLDSSVAFEAEAHYASLGHIVISNSKNHRMETNVPLVIPEINPNHLEAIREQPYYKKVRGAIITNPNCASIGLCLALAPLHQQFTVTKIVVHTMQATSGAGYPGVSSVDILGNVVPYIEGEEKKLETETKKIFGAYSRDKGFEFADMAISAHCNRVAVVDGHTENVSVEFVKRPQKKDIIEAWQCFRGYPQEKKLYMAPEQVLWYFSEENRPQPATDLFNDNGMATSIGRLRDCAILDYKFTLLSHNTIRGAAGSAILNAETICAMGII